jgi:hypothetical protein
MFHCSKRTRRRRHLKEVQSIHNSFNPPASVASSTPRPNEGCSQDVVINVTEQLPDSSNESISDSATSFIYYFKYKNKNRVRKYPIDSSLLGIYEVSNLSKLYKVVLSSINIDHKCILLPVNDKDFRLCVPLLHSCS